MADNLYWVWLSECLGPASRDLEPLLRHFGSPFDVYSADESMFYRIPGVSEATLERLSQRHDLEGACRIVDQCTVSGIGILCYGDPAYPERLKSLRNPPTVLYYRGKLPDWNSRVAVAMVGTRSMSEYGGRTAYKIAYELASAGVLVVSGMALGIDSVAQCAAMAAGGETVAVLGCGVDITYPPAHGILRNHILTAGAVISEYPPGTPAYGRHFPVRNRIISGLSHGALIVEADLRSGAMITAREALVQGRDLFAVPGNVGNFHSAGTNELIHAGANMVLTAKDVLDHYSFLYGKMLNLPAYFASVMHFDPDEAVLDRYGVSARPADFKYAKGKGSVLAPAAEPRPASPPPAKPDKKTPPTPRKEHLPGEPKKSAKADVPPKPLTAERRPAPAPSPDLPEDCRAVYDLIPADRAVSADTLAAAGIAPAPLIAALTRLELLGLIEGLPGSLYIRTGD